MKKVIFSLLEISVLSLCLFTSCKEEQEISPDSAKESLMANSLVKAEISDNNLLQIIDDNSLDCFDKGKVLLDQDELSETVIDAIIDNSAGFDPYTLELILSSQYELSDYSLKAVIGCSTIDDATLEGILYSKPSLSNDVKSHLYNVRGMVLNGNLNGYEKFLSACGGGIYYAEEIIEIKGCNETQYILKNIISHKGFVNLCDCDQSNQQKLLSGGGGNWTRGKSSTTTNDGITIVTCSSPPTPKCAKRLEEKSTVQNSDIGLINFMNSNSDDFLKGKKLLNEGLLSENVQLYLIENVCNIDPAVFEIVFVSQDFLSDNVVINLIMNKDIPDNVLSNILIANSPVSPKASEYLMKFRHNLDLAYINGFSNKDIAISLCMQSLIYGEGEMKIIHNGKSTEIEFQNVKYIPFASDISDNNLSTLRMDIGGTWIQGELSLVVTTKEVTKFYCVSPPNTKCVKVK